MSEAEIQREQELLRAVFEAVPEAMLVSDDDGRYVDANAAACVLLGLTRGELIGRRMSEFAVSNSAADLRAPGEFPLFKPDGTRRDVAYGALADILPGLHLSILRDVTGNRAAELASRARASEQRELAETALQESQRILEEGQSVAHLGSWTSAGHSEHAIAWSSECARIFGCSHASAPTRKAFCALVHPDDWAYVSAEISRARAEGTPCETEHRVVLPTGDVRWVYAKTVTEENGQRMVGVVQDISERKRVMDELRASELRYRRIVENTSEGVWMYDAAGITTFINARTAEMLGCAVDDAIGQSIYDFMDERSRREARERVAHRARGLAERGEFRLTRRDGTELWVSLHVDPLFDRAGNFEGSLALVTDISEHRQVDDIRNRLAAIVESSEDAIISEDLDGAITSWNRGAEHLFQWSGNEVIGQPMSMLIPTDLVGDLRHVQDQDFVQHYETVRLKRDGSRVEVALSVSPIRHSSGVTIGFSKIARDLTEQRKVEAKLRQTEGELRQGQKMEAVGSLAGGVAHDFNNLLSIILTYTQMLLSELPVGNPMIPDLEQIDKAGEKAARLTKQLLAFSRQQILEPQVLDLNQLASGLEEMLGRLLGERVRLSLLQDASLGRIFADPGQVEQVLMNLVVNARDAMPEGGSLTVETANVEFEGDYVEQHLGVEPGSYVMVAVTDTGTGMDAKTAARIFEPFFTTKDKDKGTGLGLSTVYGIVRQSNGHIFTYSELGAGTTFKVYFPRSDLVPQLSVAPPAPVTLDGTETILVVEDDDSVRSTVRTILLKRGYNVLEAASGEEGLLMCEQYRSSIDLLLTDVVMPRMTGRKLAERAGWLRPDLKVLFMSGYTEDTIVHHGVLDPGINYLPKPITPVALARKVREVIDSPGPPTSATAAASPH